MRTFSFAVLATVMTVGLGACTEAESRAAPADAEPLYRTVPANTSMVFRVAETVSTDTHAKGDRFTAVLRAGVADIEGAEVIPQGATSHWIVTESTTEDGETLLAFRIEAIELGGEWLPIDATVTGADLETDEADTSGETAAKVGVGAAAGAIIGQVLGGNTESTLKGAGVGAAVGAAVALTTRGGSATLAEGSSLTIQLSEPMVIR